MIIKIWHDEDGFALEFESEKLALSADDFSLLIDELAAIRDEPLEDDDECMLRTIAVGLPDE